MQAAIAGENEASSLQANVSFFFDVLLQDRSATPMLWIFPGLFLYWLVHRAEQALLGVSTHESELISQENDAANQRATKLLRSLRTSLEALLLARTTLKMAVAVFVAAWMAQQPVVRQKISATAEHFSWPEGILWSFAAIATTIVLTSVFWLLVRLRLPFSHAETLAKLSGFIVFWQKLFRPFISKSIEPENSYEKDEAGKTPDSSQKSEMEMLKSIVKFSDVTVKQVMQPRSRVIAVDFRSTFYEVLETVRDSGFSRMPVYDDDFDNVTGILYVKDLLPHLKKPAGFEWQSLIRTNVLVAPESKRASELLQEFKQRKRHMAIVVNEYGGSAGIVTMEDILEEVTGEIRDEFDEENEFRFRKIDERNYVFEGQTLLNDVCRITGLDPDTFDKVRGNADTLAGLALEINGDIPGPGAEIAWNGFLLTITAAGRRRIEQLKMTLPPL